jgi:hypothetical protein
MAAPTFVTSYTTNYSTAGSSKNLSITTQPGDTLVVFGGGDTNGSTALSLNTPTGNSVSFGLQQSIAVNNNASAYIWSGVDTTGGTNWTLTCTVSSASPVWGFTCAVFRNTGGVGASNKANTSGAPTLNLTTTSANSAIVMFNSDWGAIDGAGRVYNTINGSAPTSGNGLELAYDFTSFITAYGAYYPDAGAPTTITPGISSPGGQTYSLVALEVLAILIPSVSTSAVTAIGSGVAMGNGVVISNGGGAITERGVCWNTTLNPTTSNNKATSAGTTGPYSVSITGLASNTAYYARAYAINGAGTSYGNNVPFKDYPANIGWLSA